MYWKMLQKTGVLGLAAALALGMGAQAAEAPSARQEDLDALYQNLEARHPDLFANTPEAEFLERKAEIESRLTTESDVDFLFDLQSLTALAGDSHTSIQVAGSVVEQLSAYPMVLSWRDGRWYLTTAPAEQKALLGMEVTALNGRDMDQVVEAFGEVLSADNPVKLRRQYRQVCNVEDYYVYLGLAKPGEPLKLTLEDGETRSITAVPYHSLGETEIAQLGAQVSMPATAAREQAYWSQARHLPDVDLHPLSDSHVHNAALHRSLAMELGYSDALSNLGIFQSLHAISSSIQIMIRFAIVRSRATRLSFTCKIRLPPSSETTVTSLSTTNPSSARCWRIWSLPVIFRIVTVSPTLAIDNGIMQPPPLENASLLQPT